jgi:hypothetical protein
MRYEKPTVNALLLVHRTRALVAVEMAGHDEIHMGIKEHPLQRVPHVLQLTIRP